MSAPETHWTEADTQKALDLWTRYQQENDTSARLGEAVGIDPATGQVWFGTSAKDIALRRETEGSRSPLFFLRVGQDFYARKGGRR
jgi:hypothetical protein